MRFLNLFLLSTYIIYIRYYRLRCCLKWNIAQDPLSWSLSLIFATALPLKPELVVVSAYLQALTNTASCICTLTVAAHITFKISCEDAGRARASQPSHNTRDKKDVFCSLSSDIISKNCSSEWTAPARSPCLYLCVCVFQSKQDGLWEESEGTGQEVCPHIERGALLHLRQTAPERPLQ